MFIRIQNDRIQHAPQFLPPIDDRARFPLPPMISITDLRNQEQQLLITLVLVNVGILAAAAGTGYILSGRTLKPIKIMVDEQNQFISNSSHELRTPIATMRAEMEASLLEKHISETQTRKLITSNLEELSSLQTLMNNLLRLAQIHHTNAIPDTKDILLFDVIESAQKKVLSTAKEKHIIIDVTGPNAQVEGDRHSLIEVFVNVLDNAIKYSPKNSQIRINTIERDKHIITSITDQGIGISPRDLPHVFERFYRADKSRSKTEGFGLGLSIARRIMDIHGGTITAQSREGQGTTFTLQFPNPSSN